MKAKTIFSICLLLGIAMSQVAAQDHDTKSVQYKAELGYYTPVYCGDLMVDYLQGTVMFHIIDHYKNGSWQWEVAQSKGQATGMYGEVFELTETDKYWLPVYGLLTWHFNAKGNWGSHYIGFLTYSYLTGETTIGKTVCK